MSRSAALRIYRGYGREKSPYGLIEIEELGRRSFGKDGLYKRSREARRTRHWTGLNNG